MVLSVTNKKVAWLLTVAAAAAALCNAAFVVTAFAPGYSLTKHPARRSKSSSSSLNMNILHPLATAVHHTVTHHDHNAHHHHHVTLAGSLWPAVQKLLIGPAKLKAVWTNVNVITDWKGLLLLSLFAFGLTPAAKFLYMLNYNRHHRQGLDGDGIDNDETDSEMNGELDNTSSRFFTTPEGVDSSSMLLAQKKRPLRTMYEMKRFGVVAFCDQIAKVALSVYAMDVLSIMLTTIGFTFPKKWRISEVYAKFAYTVWAVQRFLVYKKIALCRFFRVVDEENMGRLEIVDRLLNGIIVAISTLVFLDWTSVKMNNAMTGLFAFGSAGTLAFTLASQGLVTQLLSGLFLMFSDKMYVGDSVIFGDGTSGKVLKLGWMETLLRDSNNVVTRVPNTLLSSQKVSNLSRIRQSQVKQTLRFHYKDAIVMPQLLEDIKTEIRAACPRLITDNTRPFRAFWTEYNVDHLEVMIDTHFNIAPFTDAYWSNRQNVLLAITKAIAKYDVDLVPGKSELVLRTSTTSGVRNVDNKAGGVAEKMTVVSEPDDGDTITNSAKH